MTNLEKESPFQQIDYNLLFILFLLICSSCISIYSAMIIGQYESNFVLKQIVWYAVGFIAIAIIMILDFDQFRKLSWYIYGLGVFLLVGIVVIPFIDPNAGTDAALVPEINGAYSWYRYRGLAFQPAEVMKVALIISLANSITVHNEKYVDRSIREDFLLIGKILLISLPPVFLVLLQPDLGTTLVFIAIVASLLLVSGIRWRIIFLLTLLFILLITGLVFLYLYFPEFFLTYILADYQLERFYGWLQPYEYDEGIGYHLVKSLLAIGSGQLFGKGFTDGTVYFPEAHTDFIFSIIGEEFGFMGTSFVISLFFLLIYRMIHTALESNEPFGSYLCAGVIGMVTFQVFQNIGMVIGLLPITGIPLPFISYGGSSILASMIAIGLVLNVRSRTRNYMFD
ncbi:FtsW/RodA/SpoVE family cell cycle protein [Alkalihalobacillus sp. AL-G]|uniref:FtsW/RodA/SpoVE family cell cycle protein n=1 Tax=Alkalihalobacillus sp. AL-G TaxID=2926399 RepID=UPI0027298F48|nr:FtsW/RodA/SpoVE family cell cycle protein [Alkalihalobacillus sp. AL-G]WLD94932.1 rod shape-determining protein RodA [Alkalihalobacillus sp. AL-G]